MAAHKNPAKTPDIAPEAPIVKLSAPELNAQKARPPPTPHKRKKTTKRIVLS
jgi:hypothetical protein